VSGSARGGSRPLGRRRLSPEKIRSPDRSFFFLRRRPRRFARAGRCLDVSSARVSRRPEPLHATHTPAAACSRSGAASTAAPRNHIASLQVDQRDPGRSSFRLAPSSTIAHLGFYTSTAASTSATARTAFRAWNLGECSHRMLAGARNRPFVLTRRPPSYLSPEQNAPRPCSISVTTWRKRMRCLSWNRRSPEAPA